MSASKLVMVMSEAIEELSNVITGSGGIIDKYIGDSIMAFWIGEDQAMRAVSCAISCNTMLERMSEMWRSRELPAIQCVIGINSGPVLLGNFGSSHRFSYTVVGDNVNLASRTKQLNFSYDTAILVTQNTIDRIGDAFLTRRVENVAVYGKEIPIYVHQVLRTKSSATTYDIQRVDQYNVALELMLTGRFEQAIVEFDLLDPLNDSVVAKKKLQAKRLLDGDEREWDGVVRMELK
jgi:adenylate cyclase